MSRRSEPRLTTGDAVKMGKGTKKIFCHIGKNSYFSILNRHIESAPEAV